MPHSSEPIVGVALVAIIAIALAFILFLTPISRIYFRAKDWMARLKKPGGRIVPKKK